MFAVLMVTDEELDIALYCATCVPDWSVTTIVADVNPNGSV